LKTNKTVAEGTRISLVETEKKPDENKITNY
jgi:hypothetical protein